MKLLLFVLLEISGFYMLITGIQRLAQVSGLPLWNQIIMEPIAGAIAILCGFMLAGIFK